MVISEQAVPEQMTLDVSEITLVVGDGVLDDFSGFDGAMTGTVVCSELRVSTLGPLPQVVPEQVADSLVDVDEDFLEDAADVLQPEPEQVGDSVVEAGDDLAGGDDDSDNAELDEAVVDDGVQPGPEQVGVSVDLGDDFFADEVDPEDTISVGVQPGPEHVIDSVIGVDGEDDSNDLTSLEGDVVQPGPEQVASFVVSEGEDAFTGEDEAKDV